MTDRRNPPDTPHEGGETPPAEREPAWVRQVEAAAARKLAPDEEPGRRPEPPPPPPDDAADALDRVVAGLRRRAWRVHGATALFGAAKIIRRALLVADHKAHIRRTGRWTVDALDAQAGVCFQIEDVVFAALLAALKVAREAVE